MLLTDCIVSLGNVVANFKFLFSFHSPFSRLNHIPLSSDQAEMASYTTGWYFSKKELMKPLREGGTDWETSVKSRWAMYAFVTRLGTKLELYVIHHHLFHCFITHIHRHESNVGLFRPFTSFFSNFLSFSPVC